MLGALTGVGLSILLHPWTIEMQENVAPRSKAGRQPIFKWDGLEGPRGSYGSIGYVVHSRKTRKGPASIRVPVFYVAAGDYTSRYSGADLRQIRTEKGVGRPPHTNLLRAGRSTDALLSAMGAL